MTFALPPVIIDAAIVLTLFIGFAQFRAPRGARRGNYTAAFAVLCAVAIVLIRSGVSHPAVVVAALAAGGVVGWIVAMRVTMIQIPAMVAFQHGAGGVAAFLISFLELWRGSADNITVVAKASGFLGLIIGAATFSGSLIAGGKLMGALGSKPNVLRRHGLIMALLAASIAAVAVIAGNAGPDRIVALTTGLIVMSVSLGVLLAIRIGGADMPVLISFLNATAGVAAAFCGVIVGNRLLIACGATVAASGSILTHVMCKGMNRSVLNVFWSGGSAIAAGTGQAKPSVLATQPAEKSLSPLDSAADACRTAKRVVIVPGYGMAVGQAQFKVTELAKLLEKMGKEVRFAIHPVAGRMPGHMNVLLAEADVPYDSLFEMDAINPDFPETDVAIVVGASDVVNPAAIDEPGTPIAGMPILRVFEAKHVVVMNLDERPGYSGVQNSLYGRPNTILLFGDAKETLSSLIDRAGGEDAAAKQAHDPGLALQKSAPLDSAADACRAAKRVVIVPGYGMAVGQAQFKVTELAKLLEKMGKEVRFAIHPVAGRMPGHMNVLLAEADVPYDSLFEMDAINPDFPETDVAIVVGASDVVNPAAIDEPGTPIAGMPILRVFEAKHVVVMNLDERPGYSGVQNSLYGRPNTILLFGDAKETMGQLIGRLSQ